jgi:hypothetical protein
MAAAPSVFCCQNITKEISTFDVTAAHPREGSARQVADRVISILLSTQPIFQATPGNTNHLLNVSERVVKVQRVQGPQGAAFPVGQPRFFAEETSAREDDRRLEVFMEVLNIVETPAGLHLGAQLLSLQKDPGTATLDSTGDLRYVCEVCRRLFLVSFWSRP